MPEHHVTFPSGELTLAGTFTTPEAPSHGPAVLLVTGSGRVDRDTDMKKMRLGVTRLLADQRVLPKRARVGGQQTPVLALQVKCVWRSPNRRILRQLILKPPGIGAIWMNAHR